MGKLIDANKLKAHYSWWQGGTRTMTMDEAKADFDVIIDLQPQVDAVEVIRCKDCRFYNGVNRVCDYGLFVTDDGYCYKAQRSEDERID